MEPTTQATVAIAVLALLLCLRRRRTGPSDDALMNQKRQQWGNWGQ